MAHINETFSTIKSFMTCYQMKIDIWQFSAIKAMFWKNRTKSLAPKHSKSFAIKSDLKNTNSTLPEIGRALLFYIIYKQRIQTKICWKIISEPNQLLLSWWYPWEKPTTNSVSIQKIEKENTLLIVCVQGASLDLSLLGMLKSKSL